ncbi:4-alpha-glucanotransferase [Propionibacterium cyclohexanicum]|uniref:4-alpha-glucanotransferase n=1 Tax=Propionibacterium cyclohexanicum TaxID=64702 RepID=A0A1H9QD88_9ACTN|nr:4-alpha-glucanotransferase [Propionibacterium cyclohexanicum]SER58506.1 4-alpha-glucanotransferase [Propionibacterium cyclohexanicum]
MALGDPALNELAELFGIATEFWDWKGRQVQVSEKTVVSVLAALGIDVSAPGAAEQALRDQRDKPWRRLLPPVVVTRQGQPVRVNLHVADGHPARLSIRLEEGGSAEATQVDNFAPPRQIGEELIGEATFEIPGDLPLGYHRLQASSDDREARATLIVSPAFLGFPQSMGERRIWGYSAQLYSVRSAGSWGVGDFVDLGALAAWSASQQYAGYVLVNPMHAAQPAPPMEPSPYLPSSRLFVNPLYIRPETIMEYATLDEHSRARIAELREQLRDRLAGEKIIARDLCWEYKRKALRIIWAARRTDSRQMIFDAFRRREGRTLRDFATWAVLCEYHGPDWRLWDAPLQRPSSPQVDRFHDEHRDEVDFQEWLQWIAASQASDAQQSAKDAGMPVGVITDLAVGVSAAGSDAWAMRDVYADAMSVGAPPDAYNQLGQDWGQPPWRPDRLEDLGYAPFRTMVRNVLEHAGGVRIDHIIGMFRLWWVPEGSGPREGTYVRYDHEALVGILALEAYRAQAVIIGEDLGTVEPWTRRYLAERGILGTSVLWFEEDDAGNPIPPENWREYCLASVNTHDLPPTAGYLTKAHVKLRAKLGLLTESLEDEERIAGEQLRRWWDYLCQRGAIDDRVEDPVEANVLALYRLLTWTPSRVLSVTLVDAVGDTRIQNQPGTVDEYPNWRVPLCGADGQPLTLEDIYRMERPMRLSAVMNGFSTVPSPWRSDEAIRSSAT